MLHRRCIPISWSCPLVIGDDQPLNGHGAVLTNFPGLEALGWGPHWQALFELLAAADSTPARVVRGDRGSSLVAAPSGVVRAKPSVRLLKTTGDPADLPVVGDWVAARTSGELEVPLIDAVLERRSAIARGESVRSSNRQVLAANIDTVFVVEPVADSPNLRRIERELALAWSSGAIPVVVLTKADLSSDPGAAHAAVVSVALGVEVLLANSLEPESAGQLLPYISNQRTAVLLGPSGAGKSTLINTLLGAQRQATRDVRETDGRGRHTTVSRELITIDGGGIIIDTPGLRALALTGSEAGIASAFADVVEIASSCRYRDCRHREEPGCAVRAAIESGTIPAERLASFHKLLRESEVAAMKTDARLRNEEKRKWKIITKAAMDFHKRTGRG